MKPSSKDQRQGCAPAYCFRRGQFAQPFNLHQVQAEHAKAKRAELQKTASYKEHDKQLVFCDYRDFVFLSQKFNRFLRIAAELRASLESARQASDAEAGLGVESVGGQ